MPLVNVFTLNLDLKDNNYISGPVFTASDSVSFVVNVTDDGLPFSLTGISTATIAHTRPDGIVVLKAGTKTGDNQITFDFGSTEISIPGRVDAKIQMYDAAGRVSTLNFGYVVTEDPSGSNFVPSEDDKTLIEQVLGEGPVILANAEAATANANATASNIQASEALRVTAENTRVSQENTRKSNETTRGTNETSRVNTEAARVTEEANRVTKETSRVNTEAARVTAENNRVTAETTRASQESARVNAETIRASQESARVTVEDNRVTKENSRAAAETGRTNAETTRISQESSRANAESARVTAENNRVTKETSRVAAETVRSNSETTRGSQETSRINAETARSTAETARLTAETTRQTQETARQNNTTTAINNLNGLKDSFVYDKNPYSSTTNYKVNNQVTYNGTTYICILDSVGNPPTNATYWRVFAAKGVDGLGTVTAINSTTGDIIIGGTPTNPDLSINAGNNPNQIVKRTPSGEIVGNISATAIKVQSSVGGSAEIVIVDENNMRQGAIIWNRGTDSIKLRRYGSDGTLAEGDLDVGATQVSFNGAKLWNSGNDGSGSGLDADTIDTFHMDQGVLKADSPTFAGVTLKGDAILAPENTATSPSVLYGSRKLIFNRSYWQNGVAVTGTSALFIDNQGGVQFHNEQDSATLSMSQGGDIATAGQINANNGFYSSAQYNLAAPQGTAPMIVASTTKVSNLNVEMVDGFHMDQGVLKADSPQFAGLTLTGAGNPAVMLFPAGLVYTISNKAAIDMNNSDIIGANAIIFADDVQSGVSGEGLMWAKTGIVKNSINLTDYTNMRVDGAGIGWIGNNKIVVDNGGGGDVSLGAGGAVNNSLSLGGDMRMFRAGGSGSYFTDAVPGDAGMRTDVSGHRLLFGAGNGVSTMQIDNFGVSVKQPLNILGGNWIKLVGSSDRILEFVDTAFARKGYMGRIEGGASGIVTHNQVSGQPLNIRDDGTMTYANLIFNGNQVNSNAGELAINFLRQDLNTTVYGGLVAAKDLGINGYVWYRGTRLAETRLNGTTLEYWNGSGWVKAGRGAASGTTTTTSSNYVTIGGLAFNPSKVFVLVYGQDSFGSSFNVNAISSGNDLYGRSATNMHNINMIDNFFNDGASFVDNDPSIYISGNSFRCSVYRFGPGTRIQWFAYE